MLLDGKESIFLGPSISFILMFAGVLWLSIGAEVLNILLTLTSAVSWAQSEASLWIPLAQSGCLSSHPHGACEYLPRASSE